MKQSTKIAKPSKDFPLTPHPSGRWCKKVRGVLHYFVSAGAQSRPVMGASKTGHF